MTALQRLSIWHHYILLWEYLYLARSYDWLINWRPVINIIWAAHYLADMFVIMAAVMTAHCYCVRNQEPDLPKVCACNFLVITVIQYIVLFFVFVFSLSFLHIDNQGGGYRGHPWPDIYDHDIDIYATSNFYYLLLSYLYHQSSVEKLCEMFLGSLKPGSASMKIINDVWCEHIWFVCQHYSSWGCLKNMYQLLNLTALKISNDV